MSGFKTINWIYKNLIFHEINYSPDCHKFNTDFLNHTYETYFITLFFFCDKKITAILGRCLCGRGWRHFFGMSG